MSELLFPARERCKVCNQELDAPRTEVLFGLYCSYTCADMPLPAMASGHAVTPQECKTREHGEWAFRPRYRAIDELPRDTAGAVPGSAYWCHHCGYLHMPDTSAPDTHIKPGPLVAVP